MVDLVPWLLVQHVLSHVHLEGFEIREELLSLPAHCDLFQFPNPLESEMGVRFI